MWTASQFVLLLCWGLTINQALPVFVALVLQASLMAEMPEAASRLPAPAAVFG